MNRRESDSSVGLGVGMLICTLVLLALVGVTVYPPALWVAGGILTVLVGFSGSTTRG